LLASRQKLEFFTNPTVRYALRSFENAFVTDISSALGIDSSRLTIIAIRSGSIIVDFEIKGG